MWYPVGASSTPCRLFQARPPGDVGPHRPTPLLPVAWAAEWGRRRRRGGCGWVGSHVGGVGGVLLAPSVWQMASRRAAVVSVREGVRGEPEGRQRWWGVRRGGCHSRRVGGRRREGRALAGMAVRGFQNFRCGWQVWGLARRGDAGLGSWGEAGMAREGGGGGDRWGGTSLRRWWRWGEPAAAVTATCE